MYAIENLVFQYILIIWNQKNTSNTLMTKLYKTQTIYKLNVTRL